MNLRNTSLRVLLSGCGLTLAISTLSLFTLPSAAYARRPATQEPAAQEAGQADAQGKQNSTNVQTALPPEAVKGPSAETAAELPLLLLAVQRPAGTSARANDVNASLSLMLRSSLRESRRYQVVLYSPDHPSIRRALLEHSIAASDLVEPVAPASLQKLAHLLGARYILMVSSVMDKVGLKTDVRLMQDMGQALDQDTWITPRAEPVTVDAQLGKLRLKPEQLLALTVDHIDGYLGIPSHLGDNIHLTKTKLIGKPIASNDAKDKGAKDKKDRQDNGKERNGTREADAASGEKTNPIASAQSAARNGDTSDTGGDTSNNGKAAKTTRANVNSNAAVKPKADDAARGDAGAKPDTSADDKTAVVKPAPKKATPRPSRNTQVARAGKADKAARQAANAEENGNTGGSAGANEERTGAAGNRNGTSVVRENVPPPTILATDAGALLLSEPRIVPPVPLSETVDSEKAADNYRRRGDIPNYITSLRQAVNDNPRDVRLRKKLIVAYQDRQLPDQAISETERAMQIAPADADLSRLYANSLTAKGDTTGAIKLLRGIVGENPRNTAAQVAYGDALLADSQFADALSAFEAAAQNDPKSPLPHRRLARVLAARAGSDSAQYAACLQQIAQARTLTPTTDTQTYQGDYIEIMFLIESRLKDMLDQTNDTYIAVGKRAGGELQRTAADLKERSEAAADFLDKLPPAAGQDVTHAHFQQGAAFLAQAVGYLRKFLQSGDPQVGDSLRGTRTDALSELSNAHTRLLATRAALERSGAATGQTTASN